MRRLIVKISGLVLAGMNVACGRFTFLNEQHADVPLRNEVIDSGFQLSTIATFTTLRSQVFEPNCATCHMNGKEMGKVNLESHEAIMTRGIVLVGKPHESLLYQVLTENRMPPRRPLSEEMKSLVFQWIANGAPGD